ncbi:hypothetical protein P4560_02290 [Heyndrickxia sporothermodurans]|uniref:hypothetical protein n=1 Tax=Heyndrickxia sporothermodurans TaxID=46224 RepID=UPI002E1DF586|nr:hypothetical protein [Heyndrickxia sporothermodurans]
MPESAFKGTVKEGFERRYTVINERDFQKYVKDSVKENFRLTFNNVAAWIEDGRKKDGKEPFNNYIVINLDEPYINDVIRIMKDHGHWEGPEIQECDYCETPAQKLRPTPFMSDVPACMCKHCWDMTKEEYAASHGEEIGDFEDYPHFK